MQIILILTLFHKTRGKIIKKMFIFVASYFGEVYTYSNLKIA